MEGQESLTHSLCTENAGARPVGCQFMFQTEHESIHDGLSLEFVSATMVGSAVFRMQGAEGCAAEASSCLDTDFTPDIRKLQQLVVLLHIRWSNCTSSVNLLSK